MGKKEVRLPAGTVSLREFAFCVGVTYQRAHDWMLRKEIPVINVSASRYAVLLDKAMGAPAVIAFIAAKAKREQEEAIAPEPEPVPLPEPEPRVQSYPVITSIEPLFRKERLHA